MAVVNTNFIRGNWKCFIRTDGLQGKDNFKERSDEKKKNILKVNANGKDGKRTFLISIILVD